MLVETAASNEGKIDLIATGLGEAPTAVNNAINYIYPDKKSNQRTQPVIIK